MNVVQTSDIQEILPQIVKENIYLNYVYTNLKKEIEKIKEEILEEFNNHPVTKEIEDGITASNISGTLNNITNLYSFIGFEAGTRPVDPIRSELAKIKLKYIINARGDLNFIIDFPTAKDIFDITPMPWATGRSWAQGIETGISGLGYYIKQIKNSRSGLGVQTDKQIRAGVRFKNTKYISDLIKNYTKKIEDLSKNTIL
jgi:hypothetical protein